MNDPTPTFPGSPDGLWKSALRGRLLAVLGAGLALWGSAVPAWTALRHLLAEGPTAEHIGQVMATTTTTMDAAQAVLVAGGALVAMLAAGVSKLRSWWRRQAATQ